jgi:hypothetical protein
MLHPDHLGTWKPLWPDTAGTDGMNMMPEFTIPFVIGLATGFILGYGVRAIISYRRHQRVRRQSYLF